MDGDSDEAELNSFLAVHDQQLRASGVPQVFWPSLFLKLKNAVFDAGQSFSFERLPSDAAGKTYTWKIVVSEEEGIKATDPVNIFLVDHAWSFRIGMARQQLETIPGFLDRLVSLMDLDVGDQTNEEIIEDILNESWRYAQFYKISGAEMASVESAPIWYIMDEFGSRIQHSDEPSFTCIPFYYHTRQMSYSIIWPLRDLEEGDEVTRDYISGVPKHSDLRSIKLLPWFNKDFSTKSYQQEDPGLEYYASGKIPETIPDDGTCTSPETSGGHPVKVFTEETLVVEFLTDSKFTIVENMQDADVIWMQKSIKNFRELFQENPSVQLNQYPCESVLNCKDLMPLVARRVAPPSGPKWLAETFNLQTELDKFVACYQHQEKQGLDNSWICKTWNLGRSFDMQVSDNLNCILRLSDASPKVAVKYLHDSVLFDRPEVGLVKFDLRYNLLVTSLKPLKLFVQKVFWIRVANKPFSLDHFDDYEKHFTVMNYVDSNLEQVHCDHFVEVLSRQYPDTSWDEVQTRIYTAFTDLFTAAAAREPPMGMKHVDNCRGFYGIDVMLRWATDEKGEKYMQPIVLEVNLAGDNKRCLTYYPNFYNETFRLLFCGEKLPDIFDEITT